MQHFLDKLKFSRVSQMVILRVLHLFLFSKKLPVIRRLVHSEDVSPAISFALYRILLMDVRFLLLIVHMLPTICQCLYLNVRTPDSSLWNSDPFALRDRLLPVIVFFHGGDFQDGSGGRRFYYASHLLPAYGNVVLVTFNYRCVW